MIYFYALYIILLDLEECVNINAINIIQDKQHMVYVMVIMVEQVPFRFHANTIETPRWLIRQVYDSSLLHDELSLSHIKVTSLFTLFPWNFYVLSFLSRCS